MRDLSPAVRDFAKAHGLTPAAIREMVKRAALCTHEYGNRRYNDYVFQIDGRNIVSMVDLNSGLYVTNKPKPVPLAPGEFVQYEECDQCHGKGCAACNFEGEVRYVRRLSDSPRRNGPMR